MAQKWFYRVQKVDFRKEKCCQIHPRMSFWNKIWNLSLALGSNIGNSVKSLFCSVFSTNFTMEQNWWHFSRALLHLKDNYVSRIPKFWVLKVPPIQISTQNGKMKILKFVNLKVSYKFRILNYLVCNMMKVFTRPTSASDFFFIEFLLFFFFFCNKNSVFMITHF
jgi:hypothetical protein